MPPKTRLMETPQDTPLTELVTSVAEIASSLKELHCKVDDISSKLNNTNKEVTNLAYRLNDIEQHNRAP